jgi:small subunit ribosomal protein S13
MARLLGVEIPNEKRIEASLSYVYGIGQTTAKKILEQASVDSDIRTGELTDDQISKITHVITESETLTFEGGKLLIEGDLRRELQGHMKRISSINCYRGIRHRKGLPVRGQRTSTNSRTRKGKRRTVGVVRSA